jgi:hypothetical protein
MHVFEEVGRPRCQLVRFQASGPTSGKNQRQADHRGLDGRRRRCCHSGSEHKEGDGVPERHPEDGQPRPQDPVATTVATESAESWKPFV